RGARRQPRKAKAWASSTLRIEVDMFQQTQNRIVRPVVGLAGALAAAGLIFPRASAQINTVPREQLIKYTANKPYECYPDGRPKVPDALLEHFKKMCTEEINQTLPGAGFENQFDSSLQVLHPNRILVGRAVTVQFMPSRPDITEATAAE